VLRHRAQPLQVHHQDPLSGKVLPSRVFYLIMGSVIYYFSGTGNCLNTAREIGKGLGDCTIVPMVKFAGTPEVADDSEVVGLVFPEYSLAVPDIVKDFVGRLKLKDGAYVFAVVTYGAILGPVLSDLERSLKKRGIRLSAGFTLLLPDNYIITLTMPPKDKLEAILNRAKGELAGITEAIKNKEHIPIKSHNKLMSIAYAPIGKSIAYYYKASRKFWTTDHCNGCGICKRLCPLGNIEVKDKKVSWGDNCVQCLACVHWCPKGAIEIGGRTRNKERYHHPGVTIKDMFG